MRMDDCCVEGGEREAGEVRKPGDLVRAGEME